MTKVDIEVNSATWLALCRWANERLAPAQKIVNKHRAELAETEFNRGKIAMLSELLALADAPVQLPGLTTIEDAIAADADNPPGGEYDA